MGTVLIATRWAPGIAHLRANLIGTRAFAWLRSANAAVGCQTLQIKSSQMNRNSSFRMSLQINCVNLCISNNFRQAMPFVAIPVDSLEPGEAPPFDVFDQKGRLLCKAWCSPSADRSWQMHASLGLYTTSAQLEQYRKRVYQEANKIIGDPNTTLGSMAHLRVKRPAQASPDDGYRTPGRRYVENLSELLVALQQGLARDRLAWTESDVEALMAVSMQFYASLAEHPEIAMILARREIHLGISPTETAAGIYLYLLASAAWVSSLPSCPDELSHSLAPYSVLARLMVKKALHSRWVQKEDPFSEILGFGRCFFNHRTGLRPAAVAQGQSLSDGIFSLIAPACSLLRLQSAHLEFLHAPWAFFGHAFEPAEYRTRIRAGAAELEALSGALWPGDFVKLEGGDIGVVADAGQNSNVPFVVRVISADGMFLPRPLSSKPGHAPHAISGRVDKGVPKVAFDAALVADIFLSSGGHLNSKAA